MYNSSRFMELDKAYCQLDIPRISNSSVSVYSYVVSKCLTGIADFVHGLEFLK